jgi:hypothetical protein
MSLIFKRGILELKFLARKIDFLRLIFTIRVLIPYLSIVE